MNFDLIGGRRFALVVATQVSVTALKWTGKLGDDSFVTIIMGIVGAYIVGNVAQRHIEARRDTAESKQNNNP